MSREISAQAVNTEVTMRLRSHLLTADSKGQHSRESAVHGAICEPCDSVVKNWWEHAMYQLSHVS